jgi:hypothetical protein
VCDGAHSQVFADRLLIRCPLSNPDCSKTGSSNKIAQKRLDFAREKSVSIAARSLQPGRNEPRPADQDLALAPCGLGACVSGSTRCCR